MSYAVKEIYYTLQGEGANTGRAAVFCRFAGCNLWSGLARDRATAVCRFCDTDFVGTNGPGGGTFIDAATLADRVRTVWNAQAASGAALPLVVCTGGEPLLQLDRTLIDALHGAGFEIAIETNGTLAAPAGIDWICVSPKAGAALVQECGQELKLVYPQDGAPPDKFAHLDFAHFYLQPMDGPRLDENTRLALAYCLAHPQWRLSLQTHKLLGFP
ncbi:MAG: 7-carboxy-7-deazaguanine synthase [Alphaproteobacteria bacterium]